MADIMLGILRECLTLLVSTHGGLSNRSYLPGRCEGFARAPAGRKAVTGGGKKRASRAMQVGDLIDKKEGHPAVRPDTLR